MKVFGISHNRSQPFTAKCQHPHIFQGNLSLPVMFGAFQMTLEHKTSILNVATNYSELFGILLKLKLVTELIQTGKQLIQA